MKVQKVSFSFNGKIKKDRPELNNAFLYTADIARLESKHDARKFKIGTGILALCAVIVTLFNLKGPKKLPENVVEITNLKKGLNRIEEFSNTVENLKKNILYPLQCAVKGNKAITLSKKFKSGIILTGAKADKLEEITNAFAEHTKELGINTVDIPHTLTRTNSLGKTFTKKLKRNQINKNIYTELQKAKTNYNEKGTYTVINLGNIDDLTDLEIIKSQKSNIEAMLENLNSKSFPGVIWAGWTTKSKSLPLFLSNLPISITKVVD